MQKATVCSMVTLSVFLLLAASYTAWSDKGEEDDCVAESTSLLQVGATLSGIGTLSRDTTDSEKVAHLWPCKNGNLFRSGISTNSAPTDLTTPLWTWEVPGHTARIGHIEASPLIDSNGNVYIGTTNGGIFAFSRRGLLLWSHFESISSRIMTGFLYGNAYYVTTSQGNALSLDLATGIVNWRQKYTPAVGADASSVTASSGTLLVPGQGDSTGNHVIYALSTKDGSQLWNYSLGLVNSVYNFMPAVVDSKVIFIDHSGYMYCLLLSNGKLQWKSKEGGGLGSFTTAGVVVGPFGLAYTNFNTAGQGQGVLAAYDINNGNLAWKQKFGIEASAAPVVGPLGPNGPVAVVVGLGHNVGYYKRKLEDGKGTMRAYDARSGESLWQFETPHVMLHGSAGNFSVRFEDSVPDTWSTAAIDKDGTIYAGWEGGLQYAVKGETGQEISQHSTGWGDQGEPAIGKDFVVFASIGKVVAFAK